MFADYSTLLRQTKPTFLTYFDYAEEIIADNPEYFSKKDALKIIEILQKDFEGASRTKVATETAPVCD